jgi:hypothetical protein
MRRILKTIRVPMKYWSLYKDGCILHPTGSPSQYVDVTSQLSIDLVPNRDADIHMYLETFKRAELKPKVRSLVCAGTAWYV